MPLFSALKALVNSLFILLFYSVTLAQDSIEYVEEFRDSKILYADIGMSSAPFSIRNDFPNSINKIAYKNNFRPILGLGFAYKWLSIRVSFPVLGNMRKQVDFGETKQFNIGFDYTYKKVYLDAEFKGLTGFSIQDAAQWDNSLSTAHPNAVKPELGSFNFSLNSWYFNSVHFKMNALQGRRAHFTNKVTTWYVKGTFSVFGVGHLGESIVPIPMQSTTNSKTKAQQLSAMDVGFIPGYAYANRIKNWQISGWFGVGAVVQGKFYTLPGGITKGFLGLAPRYDFRLIVGYSSKDYFLFLSSEIDNKTIRFNDFVYRQNYYSLKLVGGYRFDHPKREKKKRGNSN
jgi:hypothetical protein